MIGGLSLDEGGLRRSASGSDEMSDLSGDDMAILDIDDDLLIDDQTESL